MLCNVTISSCDNWRMALHEMNQKFIIWYQYCIHYIARTGPYYLHNSAINSTRVVLSCQAIMYNVGISCRGSGLVNQTFSSGWCLSIGRLENNSNRYSNRPIDKHHPEEKSGKGLVHETRPPAWNTYIIHYSLTAQDYPSTIYRWVVQVVRPCTSYIVLWRSGITTNFAQALIGWRSSTNLSQVRLRLH